MCPCGETSDPGYLDLSATSIEGEGTDDVSAVGEFTQAALDVGGVTEAQMTLIESGEGGFINYHRHVELGADHIDVNWNRRFIFKKTRKEKQSICWKKYCALIRNKKLCQKYLTQL